MTGSLEVPEVNPLLVFVSAGEHGEGGKRGRSMAANPRVRGAEKALLGGR